MWSGSGRVGRQDESVAMDARSKTMERLCENMIARWWLGCCSLVENSSSDWRFAAF